MLEQHTSLARAYSLIIPPFIWYSLLIATCIVVLVLVRRVPDEALIHAILNFDGGVLVISHDEHLVTSICEELWVAEPGRVRLLRSPHPESETAVGGWRTRMWRGSLLGASSTSL